MVVDNGVRGDSRVIKAARSVQEAGYEVIVLGHGPREDARISGVDVRLHPAGVAQRESSLAKWALRNVAMDPGDMRVHRQRMAVAAPEGRLGRSAIKATVGVRWRLNRYAGWGPRELEMSHSLSKKYPQLASRFGKWEQLDPWLAGIWRGLIDPITELQPDLIHAHDYRVLPAVMAAAHELRRQGSEVKVVYDAHEYIPGLVELGEKRRLAATTIERSHIHGADAVVTVSDDLARRIQVENKLRIRPTVVCNAPEYPGSVAAGPSLRARLGVAAGTPLLVYAGSVGGSRLLQQCVRALPLLPGVHLALVVSHPTSNVMLALKDVAAEAGVTDRLHLTRYVPADSIVDFLRNADVGLAPIKHTANVQDSLPTKTFEYLAAGVPQVVSDLRALKEFVREHGIGEVFEAEDLDSMVEAIRLVLADRESYASNITQELIDQNSWETQASRLLDLYDGLLAESRHGDRRSMVMGEPLNDADPTTIEAELPEIRLRRTHEPVRLAVLPNGGGMGDRCARAARLLPHVGVTRAVLGPAQAETPTTVDWAETSAVAASDEWGDRLLEALAQTQTHVIMEDGWGRVAGRGRHDLLAADVGVLESRGVVVAQSFTAGSLASTQPGKPETDVAAVANWLGLRQFVPTPDLLDSLPNATWLPTILRCAVALDRMVLTSPRPVVLQLLPKTMGDRYVGGSLDLSALHDEGIIDLFALSGVPQTFVPALLKKADVVIDQFGLGEYGESATRFMAAGCLTLTSVHDAASAARSPIPPVVDVASAPLAELVRDIAERPEEYRAMAAAGPGYVQRWHDGRETLRVMADFLGVDVDGVAV